MTGKIRIGVAERGSLKNIRKRAYPVYSKVVHNVNWSLTCSEFNMHMQNQLKAGSFIGTKAVFSHDVQFFSYTCAMKMNGFEMTL